MISQIEQMLGDAKDLLTYESKTISKNDLYLPGPNFVSEVVSQSDRTPAVRRLARGGGVPGHRRSADRQDDGQLLAVRGPDTRPARVRRRRPR